MKLPLLIVLLATLIQSPAQDHIRLLRAGQPIPQPPGPALLTNTVALLQSASFNSTATALQTTTWDELLQTNTCILVTLVPPRNIAIARQPATPAPPANTAMLAPKQQSIDQILIALPHDQLPGHLYARSGTNTLALTKYSPAALKKIIIEPALDLARTAPYAPIANLPDVPPPAPPGKLQLRQTR